MTPQRQILDALAPVADRLPASVVAAVERTARADALAPGEIGLAVREASAGTYFCLVAGDRRTGHEAIELARAFVGRSFARRKPPATHLPAGDPFADEVRGLAGADEPIVLLADAGGAADRCAAALESLLDVRARRPQVAVAVPRRIGEVLRDFEDAVAREDIATARRLIDEASGTGRLTLVNRSLLQVRVLAAARAWSEVLDHVERHRLGDLPLPGPVQHDIVRAGFACVLRAPLDVGVEEAVGAYRERLAPRIGDVFRDHRAATSAEARQAWMIRYVARGAASHRPAIEEVLAQASPEELTQLRRIADHAAGGEAGASRADPRVLLREGDDAAAWAAAQERVDLPAEVRADALARAARRLADPVRAAQAATAVSEVADQPLADVRTAGVHDWFSWLQTLFEDPDWGEAGIVLEAGADAWTERLARDASDLAQLPALIEALAGVPAFHTATPALTRAILPEGSDLAARLSARRPLLDALARAIAAQPTPGSADLETLADVVEALLSTGVDAERYDELAASLADRYDAMGCPPSLARWVIDVVASLLTSPAPGASAREAAMRRMVAALLPDARRRRPLIRPEAWLELAELLDSYEDLAGLVGDVRVASKADADDELAAALERKTILLHTLVGPAAERAKEHLLELVDTAKIWTDTSTVANDRLRDRARRADIVVVATRACKHAAFDCVQAAAGGRIAYASGKGWSSLVAAVRETA